MPEPAVTAAARGHLSACCVVVKYVGLASVAGLDWPTIQTLNNTTLERRVVQGRLDRPSHSVLPDYSRKHHELRRKGMP